MLAAKVQLLLSDGKKEVSLKCISAIKEFQDCCSALLKMQTL